MIVRGKVFTGVGRGAYFISIPMYKNAVREFLGFDPFPGTLNVRFSHGIDFNFTHIYRVPAFEYCGKKFGEVLITPIRISRNGKTAEGGVVLPVKTCWGNDVIEIVAETSLRKYFDLNDGDEIEIEFL